MKVALYFLPLSSSCDGFISPPCIKVKITSVTEEQPYDLNLLVRALDGEVRPSGHGHVCRPGCFQETHWVLTRVMKVYNDL